MTTTSSPFSEKLQTLSEDDLRQKVLLPILRRNPDVSQITDVHGVNERGLDIIFASADGVRTNWYGLQLKRGNISGGGSGKHTVKTIIDQLELAKSFKHPVSTPPAGEYHMDYLTCSGVSIEMPPWRCSALYQRKNDRQNVLAWP